MMRRRTSMYGNAGRGERAGSLLAGLFAFLLVPSFGMGELYWVERGPECDGRSIRRMTVGNGEIEDLITPMDSVGKMAVDASAGVLYWARTNAPRAIVAVDLSTLNETDLITVESPYNLQGFDLDLVNGKIYWIEGRGCSPCGGVVCKECPRIRRANLDGTEPETIVTLMEGESNNLDDIAVDPQNGKVYWSDRQFSPVLRRANLDGTNVETIFQNASIMGSGIGSIALDVPSGKIYYVEPGSGIPSDNAIRRANLDGSNAETLVSYVNSTPRPRWLALDLACGRLYWTRSGFCPDGTGALLSSDLNAMHVVEELSSLGITFGIAQAPLDSDGDGVPDCIDGCPNDPNKFEPGVCGCGVPEQDPCPADPEAPPEPEAPTDPDAPAQPDAPTEPDQPALPEEMDQPELEDQPACGAPMCGMNAVPTLGVTVAGLLFLKRRRGSSGGN